MKIRTILSTILIALTLMFTNQTHATLERNLVELIDDGQSENAFNTPNSSFGPLLSTALENNRPNYCIHASGVIVHRWIEIDKKNAVSQIGLQEFATKKLSTNNQDTQALSQFIKTFEIYLKNPTTNKNEIIEQINTLSEKLKGKLKSISTFLAINKNDPSYDLKEMYAEKNLNFLKERLKEDDSSSIEKKGKSWDIFYFSPSDTFIFVPNKADTSKIKSGFNLEDSKQISSFEELKNLVNRSSASKRKI